MSTVEFEWANILDRPIFRPGLKRHAVSVLPEILTAAIPDVGRSSLRPGEQALLTEYAMEQVAGARDWFENANSDPDLPFDRYVVMSALQKAIRLNDPIMGAQAFLSLINSGHQAAAWRRLRVISVEDVGVADPAVAIFVMWLAGNCGLRSILGQKELGLVALDHLCRATKSRDMCDLNYWLNLPGTIDAEMHRNVTTSTPDLLDLAADEGAALRTRAAVVRAFYPHRFRKGWEWSKRRLEDRMALYRRLETDPLVVAMIEKDLEFGTDVLTCMGPIVDLMVRASPTTGAGGDPLDAGETPTLVHGVYGSAYDRHTWLGRRAIAEMLHMSEDFRAFFRRHRDAHPMECLMRATFYVEGGILRPRLMFEGGLDLYWSVLDAKFASTGLPGLDDGGFELLTLTRDAIPQLNDIRRRMASWKRA